MIDTSEALHDLVARARQAEAVALDTEFVWERTYYPGLGLVQLGLGEDDVHLIDVPAIGRLDALAPLLEDPAVVKVLHDAVQDVQILLRASGASAPRNVFDSQRAAGFVGLGASVSLQELIRWSSGLTLDKGETRTDWLRRPLTPEQARYAEDDVRYLLTARDRLLAEAEARGRAAWVHEEMARYDNPALYAAADEDAAVDRLKVKGIGQLPGQARTVLRHLATWREREAQAMDRTRRMVLPDEALFEIARRGPASSRDLAALRLTDRQIQRFGPGVLEAVEAGRAAPPEPAERRGRPGPEEERQGAVLALAQALVAGRCAAEGVDPALAASKADLRALVEGTANGEARPGVLDGWRRALVGEALEGLFQGTTSVGLDPETGWPRPV